MTTPQMDWLDDQRRKRAVSSDEQTFTKCCQGCDPSCDGPAACADRAWTEIERLRADRNRWRELANDFADAGTHDTAHSLVMDDYLHGRRPAVADIKHRLFVLQRDIDETGVSGTGIVAEGVAFSDGTVALRWTSAWPTSVVFHERGVESVEAIHGHGGKTRVVWQETRRG